MDDIKTTTTTTTTTIINTSTSINIKTTNNDKDKLKDKEYLSTLSKDELINLIVKNKELDDKKEKIKNKNNIFNMTQQCEVNKKKKRRNKTVNVNFDKCYKRHVAFKVSYVGWPFFGFAAQDCSEETIENYLIKAFLKTSLIPDIKSANYFKSGRTDKGVSAYGQVISLYVRSNLTEGDGIIAPIDQTGGPISNRTKSTKTKDQLTPGNDNEKAKKGNKKIVDEFPYVKMLNGVLPPEIRIIAWAPVPFHFNARFSTLSRTYKYFFHPSGLDINIMREASRQYIGEHDYTNFCKIDLNVKSFYRSILQFDIEKVENSELYVATIKGFAFLWHQIRCMMAVLFLIGQNRASPDMIPELLDTSKTLNKPPYEMASEVPLVLFDCGYDDVDFIYESSAQEKTLDSMLGLHSDYLVKYEVNNLIRLTLKNTDPTCTSFPPRTLSDIANSNNTTDTSPLNIGEKRKHTLNEIEEQEVEEESEHKHKHNKN